MISKGAGGKNMISKGAGGKNMISKRAGGKNMISKGVGGKNMICDVKYKPQVPKNPAKLVAHARQSFHFQNHRDCMLLLFLCNTFILLFKEQLPNRK